VKIAGARELGKTLIRVAIFLVSYSAANVQILKINEFIKI
jgi:hypothetical protein